MFKILSLQASQIRLPRIFFVRRILVTLATWDEAPVSSCYLEEKKLVSKMIKILKKIRKVDCTWDLQRSLTYGVRFF